MRMAISVRFCTLGDAADLVLVMPPRHCSKPGGGHPCRSNWADHTSMGDHARRGAGGNWSDAQCSLVADMTRMVDGVHGFDTLSRSSLLVTTCLSYLLHPSFTLASVDAYGHMSLLFFLAVTTLGALVLMHYLSAIFVIAYIESLGRFSQKQGKVDEAAMLLQQVAFDAPHDDDAAHDQPLHSLHSTALVENGDGLSRGSMHAVQARLRKLQEVAACMALYPYPMPSTGLLRRPLPETTYLQIATWVLTGLQSLSLFLKSDTMSPHLSAGIMQADSAFLFFFVLQSTLKMVAHGPLPYFAQPLCSFECVVTALSLLGWISVALENEEAVMLDGDSTLGSQGAGGAPVLTDTGNSFHR